MIAINQWYAQGSAAQQSYKVVARPFHPEFGLSGTLKLIVANVLIAKLHGELPVRGSNASSRDPLWNQSVLVLSVLSHSFKPCFTAPYQMSTLVSRLPLKMHDSGPDHGVGVFHRLLEHVGSRCPHLPSVLSLLLP